MEEETLCHSWSSLCICDSGHEEYCSRARLRTKMANGVGCAEVLVTLRSHIEMFRVQHGDLEMPRKGLLVSDKHV